MTVSAQSRPTGDFVGPTPGREGVGELVGSSMSAVFVDGLRTLGRAVELAWDAVRGLVTDVVGGRFPWREMMNQVYFLIVVTTVPAILMAIPFGVVVSIQIGNLIHQLGADSMIGAAGGMTVIQQGAPMATGLLLGGAGASAIASDLGARTIREEIDALRTMGVDPVRRLVAPRMAAMTLVAPLVNILIITVGVLAGYAVAIGAQSVTPGSYWATFGSFTSVLDVWISMVKATIFGFLVVIIACQRGLEAKGGPRGVADGVNAAVVLSVAAIVIVNLVAAQIVAMFVPVRMG
jgi:phospholipid/cholesterol/gamma-HCH transport system permease protein